MDEDKFTAPAFLRPIFQADIVAVQDLMRVLARSSPEIPTCDHICDVVSHELIAVVRLRDTDQMAAMASLRPLKLLKGYTGLVHEVAVRKEHQGQGLATVLMDFLEREAKAMGMRYLELTSGRTKAQKLYDKLGYTRRETVVFRKQL
jgi:GNAT superfamily N-acetyltransferase